jgi:hypothetical protein
MSRACARWYHANMDDTLDLDPRGNRFSDDIKEVAYQLWAFVCSRRVAAVSDLLASGQYGDAVEVSSRQVKRWEQSYAWSQRVSDDLKAIAPDIRQQTIAEIVFGALDGARYLRAVVDGREERPSKERVTSALGLLDKAGLSHTGTKADPIAGITQGQPVAAKALALSSVSDEDLDNMERQLSERRDEAIIKGRR